jgi:hypothetical protein
MESRELRVELESDPVVFEVGKAGGSDQREVVLRIFGATGRANELSVQGGAVPDAGAFHFTVGFAEVLDLSDHPEEPVLVRIPVTCTGGTDGAEAAACLKVTVSFGSALPQAYEVGLIASANRVLPLWQVLREEYSTLKPAWAADFDRDPVLADPGKSDTEKLAALYAIAHRHAKAGDGLVGLGLSGGGIRSATFNMGVLQSLARVGILSKVDYLSSVSGGGYIASWLSGWIHRAGGLGNILAEVRGSQPDPVRPEPEQVTHLRQYSNYLTPRLGLLSADTWTAVAIVVRNLILNLLVLIPVLAAALALPLLAISKPRWLQTVLPATEVLPDVLFWIAALLCGVALFQMSLLRASSRPALKPGEIAPPAPAFLKRGLLPLVAAVPLVLIAVDQYGQRHPYHELLTREVLWRCAVWSIVVPILAFWLSVLSQRRLWGRRRASLQVDLLALFFSGLIEGAIYVGVLKGWVPGLLDSKIHLYEILGPGLVLGPMLLGKTLFIAFSSIAEGGAKYPSELGDADREWWARWSGWVLLASLLWIAAGALVFLGPMVLYNIWARISTVLAAGGLGTMISMLARGETPIGQSQPDKPRGGWRSVVTAIAVPLFCVALLLIVSVETQELFWVLPTDWTGAEGAFPAPFRGFTLFLCAAIAALFFFGWLAGRFVNVNRFSLQGTYRNRLVRSYLGASNRKRRPNLFTGFDLRDNLRLHALRGNRPFPLINMALNLVAGEDLAWQQRKAESFTATPLHCGNGRLGYRRSQLYGGPQGISLGTAVATSGAAANPNMGAASSPALGFIMTVFNVRLGIWLGNPGPRGAKTYTRGGPTNSAAQILDEALGFTDANHPYINLSDGGHFENLALYEQVRRRCRFIVIGDAGCDPSFAYDDLGNAIRKIRIDFGISIDFSGRINIFPKNLDQVNPAARYCAVGTIHYSDVDGPDAQDGTLIYIKPAICGGTESYDVYNYARSSQRFPHEPTSDQWFSESQFESYRALGREAVLTMVRNGPHDTYPLSLKQFQDDVEEYIRRGPQPMPEVIVSPPRAQIESGEALNAS